MTQTSTEGGPAAATPATAPPSDASQEPQRRDRERSGILGEPAGVPPGTPETSDGSERTDPLDQQVPQDGDHWRR